MALCYAFLQAALSVGALHLINLLLRLLFSKEECLQTLLFLISHWLRAEAWVYYVEVKRKLALAKWTIVVWTLSLDVWWRILLSTVHLKIFLEFVTRFRLLVLFLYHNLGLYFSGLFIDLHNVFSGRVVDVEDLGSVFYSQAVFIYFFNECLSFPQVALNVRSLVFISYQFYRRASWQAVAAS